MPSIMSGILSLIQQQQVLKDKLFRLENCLLCNKSGIWLHGTYCRKADRSCTGNKSLNPIFIQRYYCLNCQKTCSVLPECIPPRRWYLWEVQEIALLLLLAGERAYTIAKKIAPSRHTLCRWNARLKEQYHLYKDVLCGHFIELGRTTGLFDFWQACLKKISLAQAMRLCHVAGVTIP